MNILSVGIEYGKKENMKSLIRKKLNKGKSVSVIAEELEDDISFIETLLLEIQQEDASTNESQS